MRGFRVLLTAAFVAIAAANGENQRLLRSHKHHEHESHNKHEKHGHHASEPPQQPQADTPIDFSITCEHEGTILRNRQTKQLAGTQGHKGSIYAVCLDGKLVCHEEIGVSDMPRLEDLNCSEVPHRRRLGLVVETPQTQTWPMGVVCFKIATNFTGEQMNHIRNAMSNFKAQTPIRFVDVDACRNVKINGKSVCGDCKNYVNINNWDEGCYAGVGYQNVGPQLFNLQAACFDDMTGTGRVMHEFGHAVGLYHEHSHPERKVVVIPGELKVSRNNYQVFTTATKLQYDPASIMHYGTTSGLCIPKDSSVKYCDVSQSPAQDNCVIPTRDICDNQASTILGQRTKLSDVDLESIKRLYGTITRTPEEEQKLAEALPINGAKVAPAPSPPKQEKSGFFSFLADLTNWISL